MDMLPSGAAVNQGCCRFGREHISSDGQCSRMRLGIGGEVRADSDDPGRAGTAPGAISRRSDCRPLKESASGLQPFRTTIVSGGVYDGGGRGGGETPPSTSL